MRFKFLFITLCFFKFVTAQTNHSTIELILILNSDTITLSDDAYLTFYNQKDSTRVKIDNNQCFRLDSSININYPQLKLYTSNAIFNVSMANLTETFKSVFLIDGDKYKMTINCFTHYELAKERMKKRNENLIDIDNFKSLIIWDCEFYCCEVVNLELK